MTRLLSIALGLCLSLVGVAARTSSSATTSAPTCTTATSAAASSRTSPSASAPASRATRWASASPTSTATAIPPAKDVVLRFAGGLVAVYESTVTLGARVAATNAAVKLSLQACNDRLCLLPETVRLFR